MNSLAVVQEPSSLVAVTDQCESIEAWAERCESVPQLRDATNKLAAIDEYLSRTSAEGRARVAASIRRLEARMGELLPEGRQGERTDIQPRNHDDEVSLHRQQKDDFRRMAEHPDVVEEVISKSTDEEP